MINMNSVHLIGKVTAEPRVRAVKSGSKVGEVGIGIPESFRKETGEWETRMQFVDVVVWGKQAEILEQHYRKGDGILVEGSLQYESWEQDGCKRNRLRVRAQRIQPVKLPEFKKEFKKAS